MIEKKQLILVGAGHSNLHLVKNAQILEDKGFEISLISPVDLYYNGVAPGVLSNQYPTGFGRIESTCLLKKVNGKFYRKKVTGIDIENKLVHLNDHKSITFDYLSINIGGYVSTNQIPGSSTFSFPIRPIESFWKFTESLHKLMENLPESISISIIGGGAAGVEIAGNVQQLIKSRGIIPIITLITKGDSILSQFSSSVSNKVSKLYKQRGINIRLNSKVIEIKNNKVILDGNREHTCDFCVLTTGIIPNKIDLKGLLPTTDVGEFIVNPLLQCKDNPNIFASGDCNFFEVQPLWKSGYHAINQGPVLLKNLVALAEGSRLYAYKPSKKIITALNLGNGTGLLIYGKYSYLGKLSLRVKDIIEKRYINSFKC